jgi:beta-xylosidase
MKSNMFNSPKRGSLTWILAMVVTTIASAQQPYNSFHPGELWLDNKGVHINAHGGGILYHNKTYYWFGEHKTEGKTGNTALVGVGCYSSKDLYNWKNEGVALAVAPVGSGSDIESGCIMERPKVIYNKKTRKFVMYFHLELKGQGYHAARTGIAVSDKLLGPYKFLKSLRPNAGIFPVNMTEAQRNSTVTSDALKGLTPAAKDSIIAEGLYVRRDLKGGQMARDMTLYVDDDQKAYHIFSSEENKTLHIAELTDDYLGYTGVYYRIDPAGWNEAPALFKKDGRYYMITSGCTGWRPNPARLLTADHILGPWTRHPDNPAVGTDAETTFHSQSTYILPVQGRKDTFIFMADRWRPDNAIDGRYVWFPILFENGLPVLKWVDEWDLSRIAQ